MNCPQCNEELSYDEVDIGIGTMQGNYHCDSCGWSEKEAYPDELKESQ